MAAAIESELGIAADLKKGHLGVFEVSIDDRLVYTNRMHGGRLPGAEEIVAKIREYRENPPRPQAQTQNEDEGSGYSPGATPDACGCG